MSLLKWKEKGGILLSIKKTGTGLQGRTLLWWVCKRKYCQLSRIKLLSYEGSESWMSLTVLLNQAEPHKIIQPSDSKCSCLQPTTHLCMFFSTLVPCVPPKKQLAGFTYLCLCQCNSALLHLNRFQIQLWHVLEGNARDLKMLSSRGM